VFESTRNFLENISALSKIDVASECGQQVSGVIGLEFIIIKLCALFSTFT
jgi:hypothetical protein